MIRAMQLCTEDWECRGRSSLPGFGAAHPGDAQAPPEKFLFSFFSRRRRQVDENEKGLYFLLKKGQSSYDNLRTMRE
jgi:hypothetical protein